MKAAAFIVMVALAGCSEPTPLVCANNAACGGGICIAGACADPDGSCASGYRYHESAGALAGTCTGGQGSGGGSGSGNGSGASVDPIYGLALGESGNLIDASDAKDEIQPSCAAVGGVDVMYEYTVPLLSRLYLDTYGSTFDVVLAVYQGACGPSMTALDCVATGARACDARTKQWSAIVQPGTYCIVVDQPAAAPARLANVRAMLAPPGPTGAIGANVASTCGHDEWGPSPANCVVDDGSDASWFFMSCGGTWLASTCSTSYPGDLEAVTISSASMGCEYGCDAANGIDGLHYTLSKPGPVWLVAHLSSTSACGTVSVTVSGSNTLGWQ
ncbi:MAG TPA: hypothetical protein VIV40_21980 [Kofleriaceae bacterium]